MMVEGGVMSGESDICEIMSTHIYSGMNKIKLWLIRGLPGSGKSTLAKTLVECMFMDYYLRAIHLEADMYHMVGGEYRFVGDNVKNAHGWCFENTKIFLNNNMPVIVSNTFTRISEMQKYLDLAKELDIPLRVVKCTGMFGNVHNVPSHVLESMAQRWEDFPGEIENG